MGFELSKKIQEIDGPAILDQRWSVYASFPFLKDASTMWPWKTLDRFWPFFLFSCLICRTQDPHSPLLITADAQGCLNTFALEDDSVSKSLQPVILASKRWSQSKKTAWDDKHQKPCYASPDLSVPRLLKVSGAPRLSPIEQYPCTSKDVLCLALDISDKIHRWDGPVGTKSLTNLPYFFFAETHPNRKVEDRNVYISKNRDIITIETHRSCLAFFCVSFFK